MNSPCGEEDNTAVWKMELGGSGFRWSGLLWQEGGLPTGPAPILAGETQSG